MKVLVTGNAGFIGFHLSKALLERGDEVVGIDNINDYYDPSLKEDRLKELKKINNSDKSLVLINGNIADSETVMQCFENNSFDRVVNLAAQAGVRKSLEDPQSYIESNITGFVNILEACRYKKVGHLTYASTSSVYGLNENTPFKEKDIADHPVQLYAATKRSNELLAHSYSHLFNLPTTGLRFFTVYGPWGRPDMALFLFTRAIISGKPIKVFNNGNHTRDFTYIDDIVSGIIKASDNPSKVNSDWDALSPDPSTSSAPFQVLNIGNGHRVKLLDYIYEIEKQLNMEAKKEFLPLQPGDIPDSLASLDKIKKFTSYQPKVSYKEGIKRFVEWYKYYYKDEF